MAGDDRLSHARASWDYNPLGFFGMLKSFAGLRAFSRRRWVVLFVLCAALMATLIAWTAARVPFSSEILRSRIVSTLGERLNADVETR
jgi:hypothetical protein